MAHGELTPSLAGDRDRTFSCAKPNEKAIALAMARRKHLAKVMSGEERTHVGILRRTARA
jgi:hypothetical protein